MKINLAPEILFQIGNFSVTNSLLSQVLMTIILLTVLVIIAKNAKKIPGKFQLIIEMIYELMYGFVLEATQGDKKNANKLFNFVGAIFFFVLLTNVFAMIPLLPAFTATTMNGETVSLLRAGMSDYGQVLVMTLVSVLVMQITFITSFGFKKYVGQFFDFSKGPIEFFVGILNIIGEASKVVSMSFRLFGNIFAGEVLTTVILFLVPLILPLPFFAIGLLSAVIQAMVFSLLSTVYIGNNLVPTTEKVVEKLSLKTEN